ncbi:peptidoglycan-binding domain-containing protein [Streptomyces apocyni]|uniref:peptidoglycan-binding domain-containing protein n=1 Tax=Streptomyces apocyni TaxID=2654677 RepID=UPI0012E9BAFA|nr:peptidoglycan-binding protein [Streptomyces apocyni]
MRSLTRSLVSVVAAAGIAAGSLAAAGTSFAAPAQGTKAVANSEAVAPLAVNNLGLTKAEAKRVQDWLKKHHGYTGARDGLLGTNSWKAFQRGLKKHWGYNDAIDGIVGPNTIKALQRLLKYGGWDYTGPIDGIAGSGTKAAFKRFANGNPN